MAFARNLSCALAFYAILLLGCADQAAPVPMIDAQAAPTPSAEDCGSLCLDVASSRACWGCRTRGNNCLGEVCLVPRGLPAGTAPPFGYRCAGQGSARVCEARANQAGPFVCTSASCVQRQPRRPDSGEWSCVEMSGVVFCRSAGNAAGIVPGVRDPAFLCGARAGHDGQQICVDLSPDPPPLHAGFGCRFSYDTGQAERVCRPAHKAKMGDRCAGDRACPEGASCVAERCIPPRPVPACWLDADCGQGARCRWGSCVGGGARP